MVDTKLASNAKPKKVDVPTQKEFNELKKTVDNLQERLYLVESKLDVAMKELELATHKKLWGKNR